LFWVAAGGGSGTHRGFGVWVLVVGIVAVHFFM
jgi:hypothetical protein